MSAIMVLNEIDHFITTNSEFSRLYGSGVDFENWAEIFLYAALAMAIHTFPTPLSYEFDLEYSGQYSGRLHMPEQFFPAFLLTLIDAVEFVDRRVFETHGEPLKQDIPMTLHVAYYYSCQRYMHIKLVAEYENESLDDLVTIAEKLQEQLSPFVSQEWGVTLILRQTETDTQINSSNDPSNTNEVKLVFLRAEEEEYLKFREQQLSKEADKNELECYKDFWRNLNIELYELAKTLDIFIPKNFSRQIRKFLERQKYKEDMRRK